MQYIYSILTCPAEWKDFLAHRNAQKFRKKGEIISGSLKLQNLVILNNVIIVSYVGGWKK